MVDYVGENGLLVGAVAGGVTGLVVGGGLGYIAGRKSGTKRKKSRSKNRKKRVSARKSKGRKLKFGSAAYRKRYLGKKNRRQKQPYTAGKRKDTSHRRIRYTKNNQPYVILGNGRARFISKKSARQSKKRKGGRY